MAARGKGRRVKSEDGRRGNIGISTLRTFVRPRPFQKFRLKRYEVLPGKRDAMLVAWRWGEVLGI